MLHCIFHKKYKTGPVLSGGTARGFAHPGALKTVEELDLKPDIISGASAGAIAGAFYADGYKPEPLWQISSRLFKKSDDPQFPSFVTDKTMTFYLIL
ncbi:MAG: patatin-like phospholipase family protein [Bacteroidales bacterium]|nr:patatin-like phospholipase family protein [Bacteroidales bacterium]